MLIAGALFAWELGFLHVPFLPLLPRMVPTTRDVVFAMLTVLLLGLNVGLLVQRAKSGCPRGSRRATGAGGILSAVALLCPVCLALPGALFGIGTGFALLAPLLPLLQLIALVILGTAAILLLKN
jgi:hypothetical protein